MTKRQPTLRPRYRYVSVALAIMAVVGMASRADAHGERESLTTPADFGDRVLARVNDVVITGHDLRHAFEMLSPETQAAMRQDVKQFLDVLIQREVLYREALRIGLDTDAEVRARLDQVRRAVLVHELSRRQQVQAVAEVDPQEERRYYETHPEQFTVKERISASHILLGTREEAEAVAARLRSGADFAALAQEVSRDAKTRDRGGRLFVMFRGQSSREFERSAFALEAGAVSGIVQDADGYHLILVHNHVPASVMPFEAVQASVHAKVVASHSEKRLKEFIAELQRRARIEVNTRALDDVR